MAIRTQIPSGLQLANKRWTCSTNSTVITISEPPPERDFCLCKYECDYEELAFYNLNDVNDKYTNDYRKILVTPKSQGSTFEFFIVDQFTGIETPFDGTLGEVYDQGFNDKQPLMVGINVQWFKVANVLGSGKYKIKTVVTDFGAPITSESIAFIVTPFSVDRSNGTAKIEITHKGLTQNGVDWRGLGEWENMVRVYGRLSIQDPEIERESLVDPSYEEIDVQVSKRDNYTLKIDNIPSVIGDVLVDEGSLGGWKVTDYNVFNYKDYREIQLKVTGSTLGEDLPEYSKRFPEINLVSLTQKVNRKFL